MVASAHNLCSEAPRPISRSRSADALHSRVGSVAKDTSHASVSSTPRPYAAFARTARVLQEQSCAESADEARNNCEVWRPEPVAAVDRVSSDGDTSRQQHLPIRDGRTVQPVYSGVLGEAVQFGAAQRSRSVPRLLLQPASADGHVGDFAVRSTGQPPPFAIRGWQPMAAQTPLVDPAFRGQVLIARQHPGQ